MGIRSWRAARVFGAATAGALTVYSVVSLAGMSAAVLASHCSGTNPASFLAITQSSAGSGVGSAVDFTVTVENEGPCSVSTATFTDEFQQGGAQITAVVKSTNPSSDAGTCTPTPPATATGTDVTISCGPLKQISDPNDANQTNPGTAVITIEVTPGAVSSTTNTITSLAQVHYAGEIPADAGYTSSHGGFLLDGGDINFPPDGTNQSTGLHVNQGRGAAEIEQVSATTGPPCPSGDKCFGEMVVINANDILNGTSHVLQQYTFTIPVPTHGPQSASQVQPLHIPDNGTNWIAVQPCISTTTPTPDPCVGPITKVKGTNGVVFFVFTVYTLNNGRWLG